MTTTTTTRTTRRRATATPATPAPTPAEVLRHERLLAERRSLHDAFLQWARGMYQLRLLPMPHEEWMFHPRRKWRYDWAYLGVNGRTVAIDLDGAIHGRRNMQTGEWEPNARGGHTSGTGYENNCEKDNEAACAGILVIRLTAAMLKSGVGYSYVERALGVRRNGKGAA